MITKLSANIFIGILILIIGVLLLNDYLGDPSIYYIYSKNFTEGFYLNFNKGEFSSGATSPLWAALLSIPFIFSSKVIYAKLFSLVITLASHLYFFHSLNKYSKLISINLAIYFTVAYYTLINGLMSYETSLLLVFIPLIIDSVLKDRTLFFFISIGLLPLVRPDALVISLLAFAFYWYRKDNKMKNLVNIVISLLPFIIYILYSYLLTGTYSSSSYCRSFALAEDANSILGLKYSFSTILAFISFPSAFLILLQFKKPRTKVDIITLITLLIYILVLSFVKPIANHPERYLAPVFILLAMNAVIYININISKIKKNYNILFLIITLMSFSMIVIKVIKYQNSYNSQQVLEYELANIMNKIEEDSIILTYEVQSRFYIEDRHQIISLDGIIDGKVAPYLENSNMIAFLNKYKPNYFVANDAINYRNYLNQSKLETVYNDNSVNPGDSILIDNITFELIKINNEDLGKLANWKKLYRLYYSE